MLIKLSSGAGMLGGIITILGIMHTLIINLGKSIAIHEFDHSATWLVLMVGVFTSLVSFLLYLKSKKIWPELVIGVLSIIEVIVCFMIIGFFSR
jgi:EamA domain-containing membrane protein RarD